jgi:hypothetical protein
MDSVRNAPVVTDKSTWIHGTLHNFMNETIKNYNSTNYSAFNISHSRATWPGLDPNAIMKGAQRSRAL